jgi:hypothetical protein
LPGIGFTYSNTFTYRNIFVDAPKQFWEDTSIDNVTQGNEMNKAKLIELLETGATFNWLEQKFFHPSFRKGWRKMKISNISWQAVDREHGIWGTKRLKKTEDVYSF